MNWIRAKVASPASATKPTWFQRVGRSSAQHSDVDRAEHERVRDRLREDVRHIEEVGDEDGEHRGREREALREVEPASEQEDRHRGEGHRDGVQGLRQAQRNARVAEEPERCGEDRLEEGREAGGVAADRRPARRRQLVCERRVDVLVGEEERGRMREREQEADQGAHPDDPHEQGEGRERERHRPRGNAHAAGYDVHSGHLPAIGSGPPALENEEGAVSRALFSVQVTAGVTGRRRPWW